MMAQTTESVRHEEGQPPPGLGFHSAPVHTTARDTRAAQIIYTWYCTTDASKAV